MKKLVKMLTNRIIVTLFFFLLQIAFIVVVSGLLSQQIYFYAGFRLLSLFVVLYILSTDSNPGYKLAWIVPILLMPIFGGLMYLSMGRQKTKHLLRKKMKRVEDKEQVLFNMTNEFLELHGERNPTDSNIPDYVFNQASFPLYNNTQTTYYKIGEEYRNALVAELKKAKKFIFMEYFIIERGIFWDEILKILKQKVNEGVDVRIIYDDVGCLFTLPGKYHKTLESFGIKVLKFNKLHPSFDARYNNRTHRKITVIDGITAFTGGINLADEYINAIEKYGHWKDTGMMFKGLGAWSFTVMFLSFWSIKENSEPVYKLYMPNEALEFKDSNGGYVQPICSGPGLNSQLTENCFMQILNNATKYVYINTPYLILDNEIVTSLCLAAKSGVDVRITMPHIPDKKLIFMMSRSFYSVLLKAGVKIYEYTPGFVHAKSYVSDDRIGYIGTCNMDYRSFYLHYECGAMLYNTSTIDDIKRDYLETLKECHEITFDEAVNVNFLVRIVRAVLRLFAPLM